MIVEAVKHNNGKELCLMCSHDILGQYYFECLTSHDDMLIFLEIMHEPDLWIPIGWGQFISSHIPVAPNCAQYKGGELKSPFNGS